MVPLSTFSGGQHRDNTIDTGIVASDHRRRVCHLVLASLLFWSVSAPANERVSVGGAALTVVKILDFIYSKYRLQESDGVTRADVDDLGAGRFVAVRERYEQQETLTTTQTKLLCDIYSKLADYGAAQQCLAVYRSDYEHEPEELEAIAGRRALVELRLGNAASAYQLTDGLETRGGQYVRALAATTLGRDDEAREFAKDLYKTRRPEYVYLAANIWSRMGDAEQVIEALTNPRIRLLRDYGLTPIKSLFGNASPPAPLRLDLFQNFRFGFSDAFSFAPSVNVYVEYLAALNYRRLGKSEESLEHFNNILIYSEIRSYREIQWMAHYERGRLFDEQSNPAAAKQDYLAAVDVIERIRSSIPSELGRVGFLEDKYVVYEDLIDLYFNEGDYAQALVLSERSKSRAFLDLLSDPEGALGSERSTEEARALVAELMDIEAVIREIDPSLPPEQIDVLLEHHGFMKAQLEAMSPSLASLKAVPALDIDDVFSAMSPREGSIVFHTTRSGLYAFCVRKGSVQGARIDGLDVDGETANFRRLSQGRLSPEFVETSTRLGAALLAPVSPCLDVDLLTIVPDGNLHHLPFSALRVADEFVIDRAALRFTPSLHVLTLLDTVGWDESGQVLVMGNPDTGSPEDALPGAELEAITVGLLYDNPVVKTGSEASAQYLVESGEDFQLIHIASHAEFSAESPMRSRLLLAPSSDRPGDLTASELYGMSLKARTIILSACETSLGKVNAGNDLIGLERGFFYAGVGGIVGSLWQIPDTSTTKLMFDFHKNYNAASPEKALQSAILATKSDLKHPVFWAAYKYSGLSFDTGEEVAGL